jgi:phosphoenolpyruvate---glycerone phosphotransferase subunit DhaK
MTTQQTHAMRKFLNDPADVVHEYLTGLAAAHRDLLRYDAQQRILVRADAPVPGKVALVSGGGSGCEPLHSGFVGPGMLDASCQGQIFSSPVPDQIVAATEAAHAGAGVLHVIKNFPGEVMNFEMAAELASYEDITVESVIVADDVAVAPGPGSAGRRGLGGTVLVEKIAGAAAERGVDLPAVARIGRRVNDRARTYGVGLSSCTPPSAGRPIFNLPEGQMEVGIGISGEPGRRREDIRSARDIAALLLDEVLTDRRPTAGAPLLVLVNGMGGTPQIELYLLYGEVERALRAAGLVPARALVGSFVTSLEQAGAALTILELDDELMALWDAPVRTTALRWGM